METALLILTEEERVKTAKALGLPPETSEQDIAEALISRLVHSRHEGGDPMAVLPLETREKDRAFLNAYISASDRHMLLPQTQKWLNG